MALPNLSGSNIEDTYQRVLHTDGTQVFDGTGSSKPLRFTSGGVSIDSNLYLEGGVTSETIISAKTGSFLALTMRNTALASSEYDASSTLTYTGLRNIVRAFGMNPNEDSVAHKGFGNNVGFIENFASTTGTFGTGTTTIGDSIHTTGNITASGNISCSGNLLFDTIDGGTF